MAVYLDHAATTPMAPEAIEAYTRALTIVGNPASIHSQGQQAKRMLEEARERVAQAVGSDPIEVVFTSGGTESINLALKGAYWQRNVEKARPRVLAPRGEHHATIDTITWLAGYEKADPRWLPIDEFGRIVMSALAEELADTADTSALLTSLWANNEVGTLQPVAEMATLAAAAGIPFHVDAVSTFGHLPIDFRGLRARTGSRGNSGLVAMSVSAHKIGGPVGVGALVLSRSASIVPLVHGGGQQRNVRSGTQDVAGAVAFAVAADLAVARLSAEAVRLAALRDELVTAIETLIPEARFNGDRDSSGRLPSNAHFTFPGAQGDSLLFLLDSAGVSVSTGSACQAGIPEPSHVLQAMGRTEDEARSAIRVTLGHTTTTADVQALITALPAAYLQATRAGYSDRTPQI